MHKAHIRPDSVQSRIRRSMLLCSAAFALLLAACAPDLGPKPEIQAPSALATSKSFAGEQGEWPADHWWQIYGDPELDRLMDEALGSSPTLKIAQARLRQAQAAAQQAGAALEPDVEFDGSALASKQSLNQGFPSQIQSVMPHGWHTNTRVATSFNFELDLYGKNRAALVAATSEAQAAAMDVAEARLMLSTAVAAAYADLVRLAANKVAAEDAVRIREQAAELFRERERQGLETNGATAQAEAVADSARADVDVLDGQIGIVRNQIAALVGKGPDRGLDVPLPEARSVKAPGLPPHLAVDLIARRPDLAAARLRAEAASSRIDVAHADFYPNIDLQGLIGFQSLDIGNLFQHASLIGAVGPAIHLPIFDGGRIEGAYSGARAGYDETVAAYDQTLLNALREVADAIVSQREVQTELSHSRGALKQGEDAYRTAEQRYRAGLAHYLDVLAAEDVLVLQRRRVADLEARALAQDVTLIRALGGGFRS
ncbi:MAG TPA: efflux transporter outer membrane subunit [Rhizomicrobium sp.]|nr:efflux transporter outer membrane subunit [Rhizomicrobium sp.]